MSKLRTIVYLLFILMQLLHATSYPLAASNYQLTDQSENNGDIYGVTVQDMATEKELYIMFEIINVDDVAYIDFHNKIRDENLSSAQVSRLAMTAEEFGYLSDASLWSEALQKPLQMRLESFTPHETEEKTYEAIFKSDKNIIIKLNFIEKIASDKKIDGTPKNKGVLTHAFVQYEVYDSLWVVTILISLVILFPLIILLFLYYDTKRKVRKIFGLVGDEKKQ